MKNNRIEEEKKVVEMMIRLYWRKKGDSKEMSQELNELLEYAMKRLSNCPFGENKLTCRQCPIHCYSPARKRQIQDVMRFSGPRMILYHPMAAILHLYREYIKPKPKK